jgi:hypothetical protein
MKKNKETTAISNRRERERMIGVWIPKEEVAYLRLLAVKRRTTVSALVRSLIRELIQSEPLPPVVVEAVLK